MSTTHTTPSKYLGRTYKTVAVEKLTLGDSLVRSQSVDSGITKLIEEAVTGVTLSDEGCISVRWAGGLSMYEAGTAVLVRVI